MSGRDAPTTTKESVSSRMCAWKPRMSLTALTKDRSSFFAMNLTAPTQVQLLRHESNGPEPGLQT